MNPGGIYAFLLLFLLSWTQMVLGLYHSKKQAPSAGKSGTWHDKKNKIIHVYYGNDHLEHHMVHLLKNNQKHPQNDRLYRVSPKGHTVNRRKAMAGSRLRPIRGFARDEKPPNMVLHNGRSVSVRHVPGRESSKHFS